MENKPDIELAKQLLKNPNFPRTAKYDPEWLVSLDMGCPTFWLLERLCEVMDLRPGMRVLDLGCGKAGGPIFLAKEYDLQVWAVDLWVDPNENWELIRERGLESQVFPLRAEAKKLPFPNDFFDAIFAVNSLFFFASDDLYFRHYLTKLVKLGGQIGIVVPGFYNEFQGDLPENVPDHLKGYWDSCMLYSWHSGEWWRRHLLKTSQLDIELVDNFPNKEGYQTYLEWERIIRYPQKIAEDDAGRDITFVRLVARRKE